jgi:hypothetical protein
MAKMMYDPIFGVMLASWFKRPTCILLEIPMSTLLSIGFGDLVVNPSRKFFLWLLLNDRLNTRVLLQRKNMTLDSYTCELCLH